jgi:acyl carrier protein
MENSIRAARRARILSLLEEKWIDDGHEELFPQLGDDEDLFASAVVDSLGMVEVIALIEEMAGTEIDLVEQDIGMFFTLAGMLDFLDE